jgi:D-glycero-D-manno-heptose 1,7-bisphosphate phosphatase
MNWAVFTDRDGVINEEVEYLSDPGQLRLIPDAARAIRQLNLLAVPVIVITNQAGIARGYFSEAEVTAVHDRLAQLLDQEGARIDRFYYCPHHPSAGQPPYQANCECRKPNPGLLLQAAADFSLDLTRCYIVGDQFSDIEAGWRAGCQAILVQTGYGAQVLREWPAAGRPDYVAQNLAYAVEWILHKQEGVD